MVGAIPYAIGIIRWEVLPHVFSYLSWFILIGINFLVLLQMHGWWSLLPAGVHVVFMIVCSIAGFFVFRKISINWFDYLCFGLAIITFFIWWKINITDAIFMAIFVDILAFLPTFKKWWIQPRSEYLWPWINSTLFVIFLLLSLPELTFTSAAFYIYLFTSNGIFCIMLWYRQRITIMKPDFTKN